jgi:hypothetical protein
MIFEFLWMAFGYVFKALHTSMVIFSHRSIKGAHLGGDIVVSRKELRLLPLYNNVWECVTFSNINYIIHSHLHCIKQKVTKVSLWNEIEL